MIISMGFYDMNEIKKNQLMIELISLKSKNRQMSKIMSSIVEVESLNYKYNRNNCTRRYRNRELMLLDYSSILGRMWKNSLKIIKIRQKIKESQLV